MLISDETDKRRWSFAGDCAPSSDPDEFKPGVGVGVAVVIECTEFEREGSLEFGQAGVGCSEFADEAKFAAGDAGSGDAEVPCRSAWLGDGRRSGSELEG